MRKRPFKASRHGFSATHAQLPVNIESINILAWCPDDRAKEPPQQVHLEIVVPFLGSIPVVLRFTGPEVLGFLIEELAKYRKFVWPNSTPLNISEPGDLPSFN